MKQFNLVIIGIALVLISCTDINNLQETRNVQIKFNVEGRTSSYRNVKFFYKYQVFRDNSNLKNQATIHLRQGENGFNNRIDLGDYHLKDQILITYGGARFDSGNSFWSSYLIDTTLDIYIDEEKVLTHRYVSERTRFLKIDYESENASYAFTIE